MPSTGLSSLRKDSLAADDAIHLSFVFFVKAFVAFVRNQRVEHRGHRAKTQRSRRENIVRE